MKVIIFGNKQFAEIAHYYLTKHSNYTVIGFTVNNKYLSKKNYLNLPIFPYENIENIFDPKEYSLFAPIGPQDHNKFREYIYQEGKKKGYNFISYIDRSCIIKTDDIGENCFIFENNIIQPFTSIGNNCIIWVNNIIGHHSKINENTTLTSNIGLSGNCVIGKNCFIGINSSIKDGITINDYNIIGMGSVVIKDTIKYGTYYGNPALLKSI